MQKDCVLVADAFGIARAGLQLFLSGELGLRVRSVGTPADMRTAIAAEDPTIIIVNIGAPWGAGLVLLQALKNIETDAIRLALGNSAQTGFATVAGNAGANIIFDRRAGTRRLTDLVRRLLSGNTTSASLLKDHSLTDAPVQESPRTMLSRREHEFFTLMARGAAPRDIAESLSISIKTVASHRARIMEKIDLRDHTDLIRYALRTGAIDCI